MERTDLIRAYFDDKSGYYQDELLKFENGKKSSFNFSAALFGIGWLLYRKMYVYATVFIVLIFVVSFAVEFILIQINPNIGTGNSYGLIIVWITSFLIFGYLGNKLYIDEVISKVDNFIKKNGIENTDKTLIKKFKKKGGTSIGSALIFLFTMFIIQIIIDIYL